MTSRRAVVAALAALLVIGLVWCHRPRPATPAEEISVTASVSPTPATRPLPPAAGSSAAPPAEVSHLADALNSPTGDIRADLQIVSDVLATFRTNFPHGGNPVGANFEITAALAGKNPLRLALIPPNHPAINRAGELCDRWGTPFFFHAESGAKMTIRSAGPDRKMWTDDDVVLSP